MHDERKILEKLSMLGKKLEDEPNNLPQIINEYQAYFEGIRDNEEDESVIQEMNQLISMFSGLAGIADAGSKLSKLENLVEPFSELMEQLKKIENEFDFAKTEDVDVPETGGNHESKTDDINIPETGGNHESKTDDINIPETEVTEEQSKQ